MTTEQIKEYNTLCAKFLKPSNELIDYYLPQFGLYIFKYGDIHYEEVFRIDEMKFHSDWNWIMEVVDAIEKLDYSDSSNIDIKLYRQTDKICCLPIYTKKEAVVQAIYLFLKWYNEQKL